MMAPHPTLLAERAAALRGLGPEPPWWRPFARRRWRREHAAIMATDVSRMAWMFRQHYPTNTVARMAFEALSPTYAALSAIKRDPAAPRWSEQQDALAQRLPQAPRHIDPVNLARIVVRGDVLTIEARDGRGEYVWEPDRQRWKWSPYPEHG